MDNKQSRDFSLNFNTFGNEKQKYAINLLLNDNEVPHIGYGGGASGGKSYLIAMWSWAMCQKYPGVKGFWGRRELKELKNSTYASYQKFLTDHKVPKELRGEFKQLDSKIIFENGSEIVLLGLAYQPTDPEYANLGSTEYTFGAVDEAQEVPEKAISILSTRIGRWRNREYGIRGKILETFNPDKGHVYRRYYKPFKAAGGKNYRFDVVKATPEGEITVPYVFIPALLTDNKRVAYNDDGSKSAYYLELLTADEVTRQRLLYGNFEYDDSPGKLFNAESVMAMENKERVKGLKYMSVDVARTGKDGTEILIWEGLDVIERIVEKKSRIDELSSRVREIAARHGIPMSRVVADENGVGGGLVDNLRCVGFVSSRSQKGKSKALNYDSLKAQVVHLASMCVNSGMVGWHAGPGMDLLAEDLASFVQIEIDNDKSFKIIKKDDQKALLGRSPDTGDAFIMRFLFEIGKTDSVSEVVQGKVNRGPYLVEVERGEFKIALPGETVEDLRRARERALAGPVDLGGMSEVY